MVIIHKTISQNEKLSFATCFMQLHMLNATKKYACNYFLVAFNMCNCIKQVAKDIFSSISYTNVGWFSFFGENL
jgi:hypothetical protein